MIQDQRPQSRLKHMGINLGCRDICVAQQGLYRPQVRSIGQQMGGKGVPQCMWGDAVGGQTSSVCKSFN